MTRAELPGGERGFFGLQLFFAWRMAWGMCDSDAVEEFFLDFYQLSILIAPDTEFYPGNHSGYLMGDRECRKTGDLHGYPGDIDDDFIFL